MRLTRIALLCPRRHARAVFKPFLAITDRCGQSYWLDWPGSFRVSIIGCRIGRFLLSGPGGLGRSFSASTCDHIGRSGPGQPACDSFPVSETRVRPIRVASHEVSFPSAFAGRVAQSEAASHRTIPLRRLILR